MFGEFAYSAQMQFLLGIVTFATVFFSMYLVAEVILTFCEIKAGWKQKVFFAFITGTLLQNIWVYGIFFIGGRASFGPLQYALVTSPNPFFALLYYYVAIKTFHLPPARSVKMISYIYYYWIFNKTLNRLLGSLFFVQGERYNYLLDAMQQIAAFLVFAAITFFVRRGIVKYHAHMKFIETGFFDKNRELGLYFTQALAIYLFIVALPLITSSPVLCNVLLNLVIMLLLLLNVFVDLYIYDRQVISNQTVHLSALFKGMEEFRGIKQDFYNVLHTYSGYLELEEYSKLKVYHASLVNATTRAGIAMDLTHRMPENPTLVSLLRDKLEEAEMGNLRLLISLNCEIGDFYIDPLEFIRVINCLLNSAMVAAAQAEDKRIYFTTEAKKDGGKLIIVTNSTKDPVDVDEILTPGVTTRPESGDGLHAVRGIIGKYGNGAFRLKYFNQELTAYVELRPV